jgi:hypothetical protein
MMSPDGIPRPVPDEVTKIGRRIMLEDVRWTLYSTHDGKHSFDKVTKVAAWAADIHHAGGPHTEHDVKMQHILDICERLLDSDEKPPTLSEIVEGRKAAALNTSAFQSTKPSDSRQRKRRSSTRPRPRPVNLHKAQSTSSALSRSGPSTISTKARDMMKSVKDLKPSEREALEKFFGDFKSKNSQPNSFDANSWGGRPEVSVGA